MSTGHHAVSPSECLFVLFHYWAVVGLVVFFLSNNEEIICLGTFTSVFMGQRPCHGLNPLLTFPRDKGEQLSQNPLHLGWDQVTE
jgi:hypothetical protein